MIDWLELLTLLGLPMARSVLGWLENAVEDGFIDKFEWAKLGATVLRIGTMGVGAMLGLDMSALAAAGSAVVLDLVIMRPKRS